MAFKTSATLCIVQHSKWKASGQASWIQAYRPSCYGWTLHPYSLVGTSIICAMVSQGATLADWSDRLAEGPYQGKPLPVVNSFSCYELRMVTFTYEKLLGK